MPTDASLLALRDANPHGQPVSDESVERYDALRKQITATPATPPRKLPQLLIRRRLIAISAAAAVTLSAVGVFVGLAVTAASPPTAYASARKAVAATSAAVSGTMTFTGSLGGTTGPLTLSTTQWNGNNVSMSLGANQQLLLVDGAAYVHAADGSWLRYASESNVGGKLGPMVPLARANAAGNTPDQILALATGLQQTVQPDGTTLYVGTIPNSGAAPAFSPADNGIMHLIAGLRSADAGAPAGSQRGLRFRMIVGGDNLVRQVSLTPQQEGSNSPADTDPTWSVRYSQLGSTPPITPPATYTEAP